jgi:hypothetical protein
MNKRLTLEQAFRLRQSIAAKGLKSEERKHVAYFYRLYKNGIITSDEYQKAYDSTLLSLGR